jgi:hypothetical protein
LTNKKSYDIIKVQKKERKKKMDNRYYTLTKIETLDIDIDDFIDDIIGCVEDRVNYDYDISYKDIENSSLMPALMKDITKKLVEIYIDKE